MLWHTAKSLTVVSALLALAACAEAQEAIHLAKEALCEGVLLDAVQEEPAPSVSWSTGESSIPQQPCPA